MAFSGAAGAQTTTCMQNGAMTTCNTPQYGQGVDYGVLAPQPADTARERISQSIADEQTNKQWHDNQRQRVGSLMAKRDCVKAEKIALQAGEFELAEKAKHYCDQ